LLSVRLLIQNYLASEAKQISTAVLDI